MITIYHDSLDFFVTSVYLYSTSPKFQTAIIFFRSFSKLEDFNQIIYTLLRSNSINRLGYWIVLCTMENIISRMLCILYKSESLFLSREPKHYQHYVQRIDLTFTNIIWNAPDSLQINAHVALEHQLLGTM